MKLIDRILPNRMWGPYSYRTARLMEILDKIFAVLFLLGLMATGAWLLSIVL